MKESVHNIIFDVKHLGTIGEGKLDCWRGDVSPRLLQNNIYVSHLPGVL